MPELPQDFTPADPPPTPPPLPVFPSFDSGNPPAVGPPILDPDAFERHEGFRETTLAYFLDPVRNNAARTFGATVYDMVLEFWHLWPREPEGSFRHQCRAAVADLRHLQGFLAMLGKEAAASSLTRRDERLSRVAGRLALRVKGVADALEEALGPWRGEAS